LYCELETKRNRDYVKQCLIFYIFIVYLKVVSNEFVSVTSVMSVA